jgi:hypothetical protein
LNTVRGENLLARFLSPLSNSRGDIRGHGLTSRQALSDDFGVCDFRGNAITL